MLYWDYLLTLPSEVERFWKDTRHTWIRSLFFTLRYTQTPTSHPWALQELHPTHEHGGMREIHGGDADYVTYPYIDSYHLGT